MNHRAAIRRIDTYRPPPPTPQAVEKIDEPQASADVKEWRRLLNTVCLSELTASGSRTPVQKRFNALKFGPNPVNPWRRRHFVVAGNFLLWFVDNSDTAKSLGCYYLPGLITNAEVKGRRQHCLRIAPAAPRRPGDKWKELTIAPDALDSAEEQRQCVDDWLSFFTTFSATGVTIGEPQNLELQHSVRKDRSGTTALGLSGLPPVWEHMLIADGFSANDFKEHRETLRMVVDFARENQNGRVEPESHVNPKVRIVFPSFSSSEPPLDRSTLGGQRGSSMQSDPAKAHPAVQTLQALTTEGNPMVLFSDMKKLDAGSQGEVYKATRISDGETIALKKIFIRKPEKEIPALVNEIKIMSGSSHPNIINFFRCYRPTPEALWISMEYMNGGKLTDFISTTQVFSDADVAFVAGKLVSALAYLHEKGLLHRDIKSDNVLVDKNTGKLALADFGFGTDLTDGRKFRETVVGTPYWMAPEVIRGDPYDEKADIWSLGILLLEMVNGEPPNIHLSQMKALYTIVSSPPPEPKSRRSDPLHKFVAACLQTDPAERASAKSLLEHPFLPTASDLEGFIQRRFGGDAASSKPPTAAAAAAALPPRAAPAAPAASAAAAASLPPPAPASPAKDVGGAGASALNGSVSSLLSNASFTARAAAAAAAPPPAAAAKARSRGKEQRSNTGSPGSTSGSPGSTLLRSNTSFVANTSSASLATEVPL
eukprot:Rhum_TRINITY_DN11176_c0_g1::Rhum_TRINITY_DN11176_c0_g1_i1::g.43024::m.43024